MAASYTPESAPPPPPPVYSPPGHTVEVHLTDRIPWWWYLVGILIPLIGFIAGIVFMARSKIGPAIALWATCFLATMFWAGAYTAYEYDRLFGDGSSLVEEFNPTGTETDSTGTETEADRLSELGDCMENAQTYEEMAEC